ncbi:MAG: tetratricopeptide repeat protein [Planctomycetota bacterium]
MGPAAVHLSRWAALGAGAGLLALLAGGCGRNDGETIAAPAPPPADPIEAARARFAAVQGRTWPAPSIAMLQVRQALTQGQKERAQELLARILAENPADGEALLVQSDLLLQGAQFASARAGFEKVLALEPAFANGEYAFFALGQCLARLGESERARAALLAFDSLRPGGGDTAFYLGRLDIEEGDAAAAIPRFQQALAAYAGENRPTPALDQARVQASLGEAYQMTGDLEAARTALAASVELNPRDPTAHYALSRVLARLGDPEGAAKAEAAFEQARAARARAGAGRREDGR